MLLVDLILTILSTSVLCETTFSQLKLLKTCRRSRLGASSLNDLMMVKLQSPDISAFEPDSAIDNWMAFSSRRLSYEPQAKRSILEHIEEPARTPAPESPVEISDEEIESAVACDTVSEQKSAVTMTEESLRPAAIITSSETEPESSIMEEDNLPASAGSYLLIEEELEILCDKNSDPEADEECFDFQNEMANLDRLMTFICDRSSDDDCA